MCQLFHALSTNPSPAWFGAARDVVGMLAIVVCCSGCGMFGGAAQLKQLQAENDKLVNEYRAQRDKVAKLQETNVALEQRGPKRKNCWLARYNMPSSRLSKFLGVPVFDTCHCPALRTAIHQRHHLRRRSQVAAVAPAITSTLRSLSFKFFCPISSDKKSSSRILVASAPMGTRARNLTFLTNRFAPLLLCSSAFQTVGSK